MGSKQSLYIDTNYHWKEDLSDSIHKYFLVKMRPDIGIGYSSHICTKLTILIEDQLETISLLQELKLNLTDKPEQKIEEILNTQRHSEKRIFLLKTIHVILTIYSDSGYDKDNKKHIIAWLQSLQKQKL